MGKIQKTYIECGSIPKGYDTLIPDKIQVLKCESYPDCTYIETVRITFYVGDERGRVPELCSNVRKVIELSIETGYLPKEIVQVELERLLSSYKVFKLKELLEAFAYRKYYCRI